MQGADRANNVYFARQERRRTKEKLIPLGSGVLQNKAGQTLKSRVSSKEDYSQAKQEAWLMMETLASVLC